MLDPLNPDGSNYQAHAQIEAPASIPHNSGILDFDLEDYQPSPEEQRIQALQGAPTLQQAPALQVEFTDAELDVIGMDWVMIINNFVAPDNDEDSQLRS